MNNLPSLGSVSYFLIDYDGFLVDSEKLYFETWCKLLNSEGQEVCRNYFEGKHETEVYEKVKNYLIKPMTMEEVSSAKKVIFDDLISNGGLKPSNGIEALLVKLKAIAPMSIVSNSTIEVVQEGLKSTGLREYFDSLFCVNEKIKRKPAPDLYNFALSELSLEKNSVLAFEDSITGIESAISAGIKVVCINATDRMEDYARTNNLIYFRSANEASETI